MNLLRSLTAAPFEMRATAQWAIADKARRRNELSAAAEAHAQRLVHLLHPPTPTNLGAVHVARRNVIHDLGSERKHDERLYTASADMEHGAVNDTLFVQVESVVATTHWMDLALQELHGRGSLQLLEATTFATAILQPFASRMVVVAVRCSVERDEAILAALARQGHTEATHESP